MEPIKFEFVKKCTRGRPVAHLVPIDVAGVRRFEPPRPRINTAIVRCMGNVGMGFAGAINMVHRVMGTAIGSRVELQGAAKGQSPVFVSRQLRDAKQPSQGPGYVEPRFLFPALQTNRRARFCAVGLRVRHGIYQR